MLAAMVYSCLLINGVEAYLNEGYEERALWRDDNKQAFLNWMIVFSLFILFPDIFNRLLSVFSADFYIRGI